MIVILVGEFVDAEFLLELVDGEQSIKDPCLRLLRPRARARGGVLIRAADDLAHDVVHGDEADDAAVLVEDDRLVDGTAAEFFEDAQPLHGARDEERLADVVRDVDLRSVECRVEQLLGVDHAAEVVEVLIGDGEYVVRLCAEDAQLFGAGLREVDPGDLGARRHECRGGLIAHVEDAVDHVLLGLFKCTVLRTLLHEILDRILRGGDAVLRVDAEDEQDAARDGDECGARQRGELREEGDGAVFAQKHLLGVLEGDLLRQKVAEEQSERRHDEDAEDERGGVDLHAREEPREHPAENRQGKEPDAEPREETHAGDARLRHGDGAVGVLQEGKRLCRTRFAAFGETLKTSAMGCRERSLDLSKVGVRHEGDDEQEETERVG